MASRAPAQPLLTTLSADHPEWRPLLVLIGETLREAERAHWAACVPALEGGGDGRPLLDGAVITVPPRLIERWIHRILSSAAEAGTDVDCLLTAIAARRLEPLLLFHTAASQNVERLEELATDLDDVRGVVRAP